MTTKETKKPELPQRHNDVASAMKIAATYEREHWPRRLHTEILHLRNDLELERRHVSAEAKRAQEFAQKLAEIAKLLDTHKIEDVAQNDDGDEAPLGTVERVELLAFERDSVRQQLATVTQERNELRETTGSMITPLAYDGVVKQRDDARLYRDRLQNTVRELTASGERLIKERDESRKVEKLLSVMHEATIADRDRLAGELAEIKTALCGPHVPTNLPTVNTARWLVAELGRWHNVEAAKAKQPPADDPTEGGKYYLLQPGDVRVPGLEWEHLNSGWRMSESYDPGLRLDPRCRYRAPVTSPQPHWDDAKRRAMLAPDGVRTAEFRPEDEQPASAQPGRGEYGSPPKTVTETNAKLAEATAEMLAKREPAEGTLRDEFDAHVKGVLARLERLEQAPARPQVTAWELAMLAATIDNGSNSALSVLLPGANELLTAAAAFLAEKGGAK